MLSALLPAILSQSSCGDEGGDCCPEVVGTARCNSNLICKDDKCILGGFDPKTCGQLGEICCALQDFSDCGGGVLCTNGECVEDEPRKGCGNLGQACCSSTASGRPCNNGMLQCTEAQCKRSDGPPPCGGELEDCCDPSGPLTPPDFTGCQDGLECVPGVNLGSPACLKAAAKCGEEGNACCSDPRSAKCSSTKLRCKAGVCVARCGGLRGKCCPRKRCERGLRCRNGSCFPARGRA
jgi:hypothetical protein